MQKLNKKFKRYFAILHVLTALDIIWILATHSDIAFYCGIFIAVSYCFAGLSHDIKKATIINDKQFKAWKDEQKR